MKLSPHEAAWIAGKVGFTSSPASGTWANGGAGTEIEVAVAIAIAESGLDTDVMGRSVSGVNIGNRDHGEWQISGRWNWDKIIARGSNWRDPIVNGQIAFDVFVAAGRKFTPWSTFNSSDNIRPPSYVAWLPDARIGAAHPFPYVDPFASLIAERDDAISKLTTATADRISLQSQLAAANAKLAKIKADLG